MNGRANFFSKSSGGFTFRRMGWITAGLVGLFVLAMGAQVLRLKRSDATVAKLGAEIHSLKTAEGLEQPGANGGANPAETVLIALMSEPAWADVLRAVPHSLPEGIWVENIQGDSAEGGKLVIEGTAYQARLVPGFIDRLRSYDVFTRVNLVSSEAISNAPDAPLRFKIQANPKNK